jgi:ABC-type transport system substrate-binding protein
MLGNLDVAIREAESAARSFDNAGERNGAARALLLAAETTWQARRVEETRQWLAQGIEVARKDTDTSVLASLLSLAATVANLRGEYSRAKEYLDEAARITRATADDTPERVIASGGHIVAAVTNAVAATEPSEVNIVEEGEVIGLIFDNLVMTDDQGHLVPVLAEEWEVRDAGMTLLFKLRRGVKFHDGSPLTAHDVKRSFERTIRKRGSNIPGAFNVIVGVDRFIAGEESVSGLEVQGDLELLIHIVEPFPIYPALLSDPTTAVAKITEDGRAVGSGPFRVRSHDRQQTLLERNPDSWRTTPARLDSIEFRLVPGASAVASALRSGAVDVARDLLPEDIEDFTRDPRFRNGFVEAPKKTTYFAVFNTGSEIGGNEQVRQALCRVLRVHDLVWRSIGRLAQPAVCLIPPSVPAHDPGRKRVVIGQEQAREMLQAAGLTLPVTLRAAVHPLLVDRYHQLMDSLFAAWRAIGVEVEIVASTIDAYLAAFRNNKSLDLIIGRYNADYDDPDNFTSGLFRTGAGVFSAYYSTAASDGLFDEARSELQPATRETLYRQFETEVINSGIILPLFHEIDYRIANAEVAGLRLRSTRPYVNYTEIGRQSEAPGVFVNARTSGGTITVPVPQPVYTIDPPMIVTAEESSVVSSIFEGLTRCGEGAQIVPWLARDYRAEDGGRRYRFWLRDARFHDGRRLTARDVRFSWERGLMMQGNSLASILAPVRGAERLTAGACHDLEGFRIIAANEFVVELERPLAFFPALVSAGAAAIVPEGTDRIHGDWRTGCVGTGPFRMVQFDPGRRMELERNPDYWRPSLPKCDELVFRLAMSAESIRDEFRAGTLSLATELYPADFEALRHDAVFAAGYREVPRLSIYYAVFNTRSGPLTDIRLRRSLLEGVDISAIVTKTLGRLAIPAHGVIPPGLLG